MEKIPQPHPLPESISFEQSGGVLIFSLPGGETIKIKGEFKGPDLTSYEGSTKEEQIAHVEFEKDTDGSLLVVQIKVAGEIIYPYAEESRAAA